MPNTLSFSPSTVRIQHLRQDQREYRVKVKVVGSPAFGSDVNVLATGTPPGWFQASTQILTEGVEGTFLFRGFQDATPGVHLVNLKASAATYEDGILSLFLHIHGAKKRRGSRQPLSRR